MTIPLADTATTGTAIDPKNSFARFIGGSLDDGQRVFLPNL